MALAKYQRPAQDSAGNIVTNITVTVRKESDNSLATLYEDEAGTTPLSNPATFADGVMVFYTAGSTGGLRIDVAATGYSATLRNEPCGTGAQVDIEDLLAVESVVAGGGVRVDGTDPSNPIVSSAAVASRTAMSALTASAGDAVYLREAGREGVFVFDDSDLSTEVTADTAEGIYVAPDSDTDGSSGAWVRQFDGAVQAAWFGAVAGGTASTNRSAIEAAITFANGLGGATVELAAGEFHVTENGSTTVAIQMKSDVHLKGAGKYATTIKLADSQNDCHVINMDGDSGTPMTGVVISDLAIDGNRGNNTGSGHCIRGEWLSNVLIRDVHCHDPRYYGIGLQGGTLKNIKIERCHMEDTGSEGIDIKNLEDDNENIEVLFCRIEGHGQDTGNSGQAGIDTRGPCKIIGNTVLDGGAATGLYGIRMREGELLDASGLGAHYSICSDNYVDLGALAGATGFAFNATRCVGNGNIAKRGAIGFLVNQADVLLSDCLAQGCSGDGFNLNVSGLTTDGDASNVSNCKALSCGGDGFQVEGDNALIMGCSARGNTGYGMRIDSGATGNTIIGFQGDNNTAGLFTDSGTGTSYISTSHARALLSAASGEFTHKIRGADGEGLEVRSGHAGDDVVDLETERPVLQFLANGALAFFIGTTTRIYAAGTEIVRASAGRLIMQSGSHSLTHRAYTVATLPTASGVAGSEIYVSDETGGGTLAFSDGTNWRRVQDRAIVS